MNRLTTLILAFIFFPLANAGELTSYDAVLANLRTDNPITKIWIDFDDCTTVTDNDSIPNYDQMSFIPKEFVVNSDNQIVSTSLHFALLDQPTVDPLPSVPVSNVLPSYQYIKYLITNDNSLTLTITLLNVNRLPSVPGVLDSFKCQLGSSARIFTAK